MAQIEKPATFISEAQNTSQVLEQITNWHIRHPVGSPDVHRRVWYRGHSDHTYVLWPGVYRDRFAKSSKRLYGKDDEAKRLNLEREMLSEFRTSGATLVNANAVVEVYFMAQHYSMPTRLLDWTTNPLARLVFCRQGSGRQEGRRTPDDGRTWVAAEGPRGAPWHPDDATSLRSRRDRRFLLARTKAASQGAGLADPTRQPARPDRAAEFVFYPSHARGEGLHESNPGTRQAPREGEKAHTRRIAKTQYQRIYDLQ